MIIMILNVICLIIWAWFFIGYLTKSIKPSRWMSATMAFLLVLHFLAAILP